MDTLIAVRGGRSARIDAADYEIVGAHRWHLLNNRYARTTIARDGRTHTVLMHRLIARAAPNELVDHINGDCLDNRRANLRIASAADNSRNAAPRGQSASVGVRRARSKWMASIAPNGTEIFLGNWSDKHDAEAVYAAAASVLYGEFKSRFTGAPDYTLLREVIQRKREHIARLSAEIALLLGD